MTINKIKIFRKLAPTAVTVMLLATVFLVADIKDIFNQLKNIPLIGVASVLILFILNLIIVSFRLARIFENFGINLPLLSVIRANISGHVASLFFISLFGQVAGRHLVLRDSGVPSVVIASLTAYERIIALVVSGGLFFFGAVILLDHVLIQNFIEHIPFLEIVLVTSGGLFLSIWLRGSRFESDLVSRTFSFSQLYKILEICVITLIARLFVLSAFILSVLLLQPDVNLFHLFAAAAITSFAANLPITIHGWGMRELAAVYTLGLLGVDSSTAIAISILIGLSSTFVVIIASPLVITKKESVMSNENSKKHTMPDGMDIEKISVWLLSIATAILVFFQIHVQVLGGVININLADPFAILSLAAVSVYMISSRTLPVWRIREFNYVLVTITLLLIFGFFVGLTNIGVTQWALANRLTGWLVILGYLSAGYLIVSHMGKHGLRRLIESMILVAAVIIIVRAFLRYFALNGWVELDYLPLNFEGYAGNRNAFAFQMLVCVTLLLAYYFLFVKLDRNNKNTLTKNVIVRNIRVGKFDIKNNHQLLVLSFLNGVILAGIIFSGSRAGLITGASLLIFALLFKLVERRMIALSIVFALIIWALPSIVVSVSPNIIEGNKSFIVGNKDFSFYVEHSDKERWETFTRAYNMWLQSPIIGSGLGVFIEKSTEWSRYAINIHSTPLWILAEFGLVGVATFTWILFVFIYYLYKRGLDTPAHRILAMLVLVFLMFGLVHEIFYQRTFWLVIGAALAMPGSAKSKSMKIGNE